MNNEENKNVETNETNNVANNTTNSVDNSANNNIANQATNSTDNIETLKPMKEVVINEKGPSKGRYIVLAIIFIMLFAGVFFLPDITNYLGTLRSKETDETIITTGTLICKLEDADTNFDYSYTDEFSFIDSSFKALEHQVITRGDATVDYESLTLLSDQCQMLSEAAESIEGVDVDCDSGTNTVTTIQNFNYERLDPTEISSSYIEAGGILPTYSLNTDITTIERQMNAQGYTCERVE